MRQPPGWQRLRAAVVQAAAWPYQSKSLPLHSLSASAHFRLAEMRIHGGRPNESPDEIAQVTVDGSIPPLAWCARTTPTGWVFTAGTGVEHSAHGMFEGVWAGPFADFRPDLCPYAFGTGAVWHDAKVVFIPPRHLEECVYVLHHASNNVTWVSNSLAFIFVESGLTTTSAFFANVSARLKQHAYVQGRKGVDRVWPIIAADDEHVLYQCSYFNFTVDSKGRPHRAWLPARQEFTSYTEYVDLLTRTSADLFKNGNDQARRLTLTPVVALSRGYDSAAAAAIASRAGCRQALTLRANVYGHDDSGTHVAASLGLAVTERTHVLGPTISTLDLDSGDHLLAEAAEFIATFGIGDDVTYLPFENDLPGTVLVTGTWGDSIWAREPGVSSGLPLSILFGKSLTEFRLRVGFAHFPMPFVGGRFAEPARRLSVSEEMLPYSVGGGYDRPIPRRIAEEAGAARGSFGVQKSATAPWLKNHQDLFAESMTLVMARYRPQ